MLSLEDEIKEASKEIRVNEIKEIRKSQFDKQYGVTSQRSLLRITTLEDKTLTILVSRMGYKVLTMRNLGLMYRLSVMKMKAGLRVLMKLLMTMKDFMKL
jgi:hypothetical protein